MVDLPAFERLLKRDRKITLSGLVILCGLAWLYIAMGAGLNMSVWEMTSFTLFPHHYTTPPMPDMVGTGMDMMPMAPAAWMAGTWILMVAMWWVMMVAMMTPSATPAILLYAHAYRHAVAQGRLSDRVAPTGAFAAGYLLVWLAFSLAAVALQWLLEHVGIVSAMTMGSQSRWLSAAVLIAAGMYQFSPLKNVCLSHCRAPASFLTRFWRPGALGALRMGILHGVYCVGCCWMLMALLFVGGIMNLVWIVVLAGLVLIEKLLPLGKWIGHAVGIILILWGVATLLI
ncbi:MAG: DUF2182 domain-containing protein [Alphaproteobacteria bacterium]|nr:DUF2182 domain-containing protein [Alphaproteobacteria bacterium]